MHPNERFVGALADLKQALDELLARESRNLERMIDVCAASLSAGNKLLLFGNGGSAAQAQHLAAEFVNRLDRPRRALAAIALTADASVMTSVANDSDFSRLFSRQIEAIGRPGDVALAISTTGASPNVIEGLREASARGLHATALLGRDGGAAKDVASLSLVVPGESTARIQEVQLFVGHLLCRGVERRVHEASHPSHSTTSDP
ncbi:MAG: SIS domain-containing protein [bacterium]|nr:SIS domain-containing protein [bacterium]